MSLVTRKLVFKTACSASEIKGEIEILDIKRLSYLTLCLPVLSADNLDK